MLVVIMLLWVVSAIQLYMVANHNGSCVVYSCSTCSSCTQDRLAGTLYLLLATYNIALVVLGSYYSRTIQ